MFSTSEKYEDNLESPSVNIWNEIARNIMKEISKKRKNAISKYKNNGIIDDNINK